MKLTKPRILILDDELVWLERHKNILEKKGYTCIATQRAENAIKIARRDSSIKYAWIDEILFEIDKSKNLTGELQRWQGSGVIREILKIRKDLQFIYITSEPALKLNEFLSQDPGRANGDPEWSKKATRILTEASSKLRRQRGVIDVIHKADLEGDEGEKEYEYILQKIISGSLYAAGENAKLPAVLVGFGLPLELFKSIGDLAGNRTAKWIDAKRVIDSGSRAVGQRISEKDLLIPLMEQAVRKVVFIIAPYTNDLDRCPEIKANSQAFMILYILAKKTAMGQEAIIDKDEFIRAKLKSKPFNSAFFNEQRTIDSSFSGINSSGLRHPTARILKASTYQAGLKIIDVDSAFRVAMKRLRDMLEKLNLGRRDLLFESIGRGGYKARFGIKIAFFRDEQKELKAKSRRN